MKGSDIDAKRMRTLNLVTPSGFRDVLCEEAAARESITRSVQDLFAARGYLPLETPTLEVMDVLQEGGRLPGALFKFFDSKARWWPCVPT